MKGCVYIGPSEKGLNYGMTGSAIGHPCTEEAKTKMLFYPDGEDYGYIVPKQAVMKPGEKRGRLNHRYSRRCPIHPRYKALRAPGGCGFCREIHVAASVTPRA